MMRSRRLGDHLSNEREDFGKHFDKMEAFLTSLDSSTQLDDEVKAMLRQQMMHVTHDLRLTEALKKRLKAIYQEGHLTLADARRLAVITGYDVVQACYTSAVSPKKKR